MQKKKPDRVIVHPIACMTVDKKTAAPGDTITFTDCSKFNSYRSTIYFPHERESNYGFVEKPFNKEGIFRRTFSTPGEYVCVVVATASANGSRIDRDSLTVTIAH